MQLDFEFGIILFDQQRILSLLFMKNQGELDGFFASVKLNYTGGESIKGQPLRQRRGKGCPYGFQGNTIFYSPA